MPPKRHGDITLGSMIIYTEKDESSIIYIARALFYNEENDTLPVHYYGNSQFDDLDQSRIPINAKFYPSYTYHEQGQRFTCHKNYPPSGAHPVCYFESLSELVFLAKDFSLLNGIVPRSVISTLPPSVISRSTKTKRSARTSSDSSTPSLKRSRSS